MTMAWTALSCPSRSTPSSPWRTMQEGGSCLGSLKDSPLPPPCPRQQVPSSWAPASSACLAVAGGGVGRQAKAYSTDFAARLLFGARVIHRAWWGPPREFVADPDYR